MAYGRLQGDLQERALEFADRVLQVAERLEADRRPRRVVDQLVGSGTSPGANLAEADEALSNADFLKSMGIVSKELAETRFWLRLIVRRSYLSNVLVEGLLNETEQLRRIVKSVIARTRAGQRGD